MTNLIDELANLEHEQWSHLTNFYFGLNAKDWARNVQKWSNQTNTDFKDLTEEEKDKDRFWAMKVAEVIINKIMEHKNCKVMHNLGKHGSGEMTCLDVILKELGYKDER
jgi:hypothetical protein